MTPLTLSQSLLESATYDYATTQINLPAEIGDFVIEWGRLNIPEDALFVDEDGGKGAEREQHITVKYGLLTRECPEELRDICKATQPFPVWLGKIGLFTTNQNFDVVKINVESPWLHELNKRVSCAIENEDTFPTYNPHATIAYVHKGTCDHLEGEDIFKESDTLPEFIASGLVYKGPGADDDPERPDETLLFSKTKKPEVVEAVLSPDAQDIGEVIRIIGEIAKESNGDPNVFVSLANDELQAHGVRFERNAYNVPAYADETGIVVAPPTSFDLKDPRWPRSLYAAIHHEAVHMLQMDRMDNPKEVSDKVSAYVLKNGRIDPDRYLQQKQEIMAHAASMVDSWRRSGFTPEEMLEKLRSGNWNFAARYWQARRSHPEVFQRFIRQATDYINLLKESSADLDPFAGCSFPADSARVRQFLQRRSKPEPPKPIL